MSSTKFRKNISDSNCKLAVILAMKQAGRRNELLASDAAAGFVAGGGPNPIKNYNGFTLHVSECMAQRAWASCPMITGAETG